MSFSRTALTSSDNQKLLLLIELTFCTGIFLSNFFTFSNGLFLTHFSHDQLPYAYITSGLTGVALIKVYDVAKSNLSLRVLFGLVLFFLFCCALVIWILYRINYQQGLLIFVSFSLLSSFYTLVGLQQWGIALNMYDVRSSKRMFSRIGTGGVIASLIGFLLASQVADRHGDRPETMLLAGTVFLGLAIVIQQVILAKYFQLRKPTSTTRELGSLKSLFRTDMVVLLFWMMVVSVFLQYLIDYNFLKGSKHLVLLFEQQSESDEISTARIPVYIAYIFVGIKVVEIILRFLGGVIFKYAGVGRVLMLLPILLALSYLGITILDVSLNENQLEGFKFLFLVILFSKGCDRALRAALDDPARKMLYQPLSDGIRHSAQVYVDGYAKQIAITLAGTFLLVISLVSLHYWQIGILGVILSAFWLSIARSAKKGYARLLKTFLKVSPLRRDKLDVRFEDSENLLSGWDSLDEDLQNLAIDRDKQLLREHVKGRTVVAGDLDPLLKGLFAKVTDKVTKMRLIALGHRYELGSFLEEAFLMSRFDKRFTKAILPYFSTMAFSYDREKHELMFETVLQKCLRNLVWLQDVSQDLSSGGKHYEELTKEIDKEIGHKYDILFEILSIRKNRFDMMTLKYHLMTASGEDRRLFAIELFDLMFQDDSEEELKHDLLSIFENDRRRLKKNFVCYRTNARERLEELVYADLFKVSVETKRHAFRMICEKHQRLYQNLIQGAISHSDRELRKLALQYGKV